MNKTALLLCVVLVTTTLLLGVAESRYIHYQMQRRSNSNARDSCKKTAKINNDYCYDQAMKKESDDDKEEEREACNEAYEDQKKKCEEENPMDKQH